MDSTRAPWWKRPSVVVAAITIVAAALRLYHLDYKSLWLDEALCYWVSNGSAEEILHNNGEIRATPPLFTLIISFVLRFGNSEAVLRAVPALAGIATVPAVYWLARQWLSWPAASLAALLAASSASQIKLSQELREYSLTMLCAVLLVIFYVRCLRDPTWKNWGVLSLLWTLGLSLQYGLALLIGAMNIVLLWEAFRSPLRRRILVSWAVATLPIMAVGIIAFHRFLFAILRAGGPGVDSYLQGDYWQGSLWSLGRLAVTNTLRLLEFSYPTPTLLLLVVCVGIVSAWRSDRGRVAVLALLVPVACTFLSACLRIHPYSGGRHTIFLTPMVYVLTGFGAATLVDKTKGRGIATALLLTLVVVGGKEAARQLSARGPQNLRPIVQTLSSSIRQGDAIYVHFKAMPAFRYYYRDDPRWQDYHKNVRKWITCFHDWDQPERDLKAIDATLTKPARIWMVFIEFLDQRELFTVHAAKKREVELIAEDANAWLYLAR